MMRDAAGSRRAGASRANNNRPDSHPAGSNCADSHHPGSSRAGSHHPVSNRAGSEVTRALQALSRAERQNRTMRLTDRRLALCMLEMAESHRETLLACLSEEKRRRVREELRLQERLHVRPEYCLQATESVIRALAGVHGGDEQSRGYLRVRRSRGAGMRRDSR